MDSTIAGHNALAKFLSGYSLEVTAKDAALAARHLPCAPAPSAVYIPWLPGESETARLEAAISLRAAGYEPVVHIAARQVRDAAGLESFLSTLAAEAQVRRLLLVGGDTASAAGPFGTVLELIESGVLERVGIQMADIAGHPEAHPAVETDILWRALEDKCGALAARGIGTEIITQFSFDAGAVIAWLTALRARGIQAPVAVGIPGPAGIKTLLRYAARCGVGSSAPVIAKYGLSLTKLLGKAGPELFLHELTQGLADGAGGPVRAHIYPFGGFEGTAEWLRRTAF